MSQFLSQFTLTLTPLTPIHIGCDLDFEPTNYVIEEGILYGFEPSQASLPDNLRQQLSGLGNRADLLGIQKFFKAHAKYFKPHAKILIPVSSGIARQFTNIAQNEARGNMVFNKLNIERSIERSSHNPYTGLPYIPGSSFKGAVRTALLDSLNRNHLPERDEKSSALEKRLLKGDFHTSPLRLLKIADLMPIADLAHEIRYAVNRKKRLIIDKQTGQEAQSKGVTARKEVIAPGQYRALQASVTMHHPDGVGSKDIPSLRYDDMREIAQLCNRFYQARLHAELAVLDQRRFASPEWIRALDQLLSGEIRQKLDRGDAFLINLGRYGGAESKTLNGDGVAKIKIMQGKGMKPDCQSTTKTIWLASATEDARSDMQPYGWALVEINPQEELPSLKTWCDKQAAQRIDMSAVHAAFAAEKADAEQARQQLAQQRLAQQAQAEADAHAEQAHRAERASMSDALRATEELCDALSNAPKVKQPGSDIAKQAQSILSLACDPATAPAWTAQEKSTLVEKIAPILKDKAMLVGKDEKTFKALLRQCRGEV